MLLIGEMNGGQNSITVHIDGGPVQVSYPGIIRMLPPSNVCSIDEKTLNSSSVLCCIFSRFVEIIFSGKPSSFVICSV